MTRQPAWIPDRGDVAHRPWRRLSRPARRGSPVDPRLAAVRDPDRRREPRVDDPQPPVRAVRPVGVHVARRLDRRRRHPVAERHRVARARVPRELIAEYWPWALVVLGVWFVIGAVVPSGRGLTETLALPLAGAADAGVRIRFGAGNLSTRPAAPGNLVDGEFAGGVIHRLGRPGSRRTRAGHPLRPAVDRAAVGLDRRTDGRGPARPEGRHRSESRGPRPARPPRPQPRAPDRRQRDAGHAARAPPVRRWSRRRPVPRR